MKIKAITAAILMAAALMCGACGKKDAEASASPTTEVSAAAPSATPQPTQTAENKPKTERFTGTYTSRNSDTGLMILYIENQNGDEAKSSDRQAAIYDATPIIDATTGARIGVRDINYGTTMTAYLTPIKSRYEAPLGRPSVVFANVPDDVSLAPVYIKVGKTATAEDGSVTVISENKDAMALIPGNLTIEILGSEDTLPINSIAEGSELLVWYAPAVYPPQALAQRIIALG